MENTDRKVLVFGSLNLDYVYQVTHFVQPKETLASKERYVNCGGKGLNQALALKRSGASVWQAGAVGKEDSKQLLDCLQQERISTEYIRKKEGASGHAIIQTTPDGENCILLYGGANQCLTKADVDDTLRHFSSGDMVVLQNEINQIGYIMEAAYQKNMTIVFNPSPMEKQVLALPLTHVDYLILNEVEGAAFCHELAKDADHRQILELLIQQLPNTHIVLTLGKDGSLYGYQKERCYQPIYEVKAVDTTAAGDTYLGYFIGSLIQGASISNAMKIAAKASAIAVTREGAGKSIPRREEIIQ